MKLLQLQVRVYYIVYKVILYWRYLSGIFVDILSLRFLQQSNFFETIVNWLSDDSNSNSTSSSNNNNNDNSNMDEEEMQIDHEDNNAVEVEEEEEVQAPAPAPAPVRVRPPVRAVRPLPPRFVQLPARMRNFRPLQMLPRRLPAPPPHHHMLARLINAIDDDMSDDDGDDVLMNDDDDDDADQVVDLDISDEDEDDYSNDSDTESISSSTSTDTEYEAFGRFSHITRSRRNKNKNILKPIYTFRPLHLYRRTNTIMAHPEERSGHRVVATDSHLYSLGGYNPKSRHGRNGRRGQMLFQELWAFNFADDKWELLCDELTKNMPSELASNALVMHKNVLIAYGGTGYPFGESCSNDCVVLTTERKKSIHRIPVTGELPTPQYGPCIVIHENYLYTIGGTTGFDYYCDVYRLDLRTNIWEKVYDSRPELREDPEGRYRHEVIYDGKHIYVLGGGTSHVVFDLQKLPAFNLQLNRWDYFDTLPDCSVQKEENGDVDQPGFPRPRKCFTCVQHTNARGEVEAFITGGLQADSNTYFSDIWRLNVHSKQWTLIRTAILHKPLYFHAAAQSNGCMYIFGGIEYNNNKMRRRKDLFKMWMTIPKLSEMCWDAMIFYNSRLSKQSRSGLLKSGIPLRFVERLPNDKGRLRHETV